MWYTDDKHGKTGVCKNMKLFENDEIRIEKIHSVDRFFPKDMQKSFYSYGSYCHTYELIYFLSGENEVTFGDTKLFDRPFSIRYLPKGSVGGVYTVKTASGVSDCIDIFFDTDSPFPQKALSLYGNAELGNKFLKLYRTFRGKSAGFYAESMMLFYDIIATLQKKQSAYLSGSSKASMERARGYILQNFGDPKFDYAALCAVTELKYTRFCELFKKEFSLSPVRYVTKVRIDRAKELLVAGRHTVTEISALCGFENVYYFSSVFKKTEGVSPSEHTKRL